MSSYTTTNIHHVNNVHVARKGRLSVSDTHTTDITITDEDGSTFQITLFHNSPLPIQFSDESE